MSISLPAFTLISATCFKSLANPWSIISNPLPQSETTNPLNFQLSFKTSRCKNLLPVAGIPFTTLKEFITVFTPLSTAALKVGKIILYKVDVPISTVL